MSSEGSHGKRGGAVGGGVLVGQVQGASSLPNTPELEHFVGDETAAAMMFVSSVLQCGLAALEQAPNSGKEGGMVPRSAQALLER